MNIAQINTLPEPGQIVQVRGLRYTVTDIAYTSIPDDYPGKKLGRGRHLVSLVCIEDEVLGRELQVFWEIETAARVYAVREFPQPNSFDAPEKLEAFLDAVRWGTACSTDSRNVQSPFRSGIDIEDYQLDPVIRAIQMPRVNLLIADDVGLGKTIEAGLVAQELTIRQQVRSIFIFCPSALQIQWQEQMRDKFGLEFRIVNNDFMKWLRRRRGIHVNPWGYFPRLITSIDYIKRDRPLRQIQQSLPQGEESIYPRRFDLLIVDEAHNIAPSGGGNYSIESQRTTAIRSLVPHFEHKLFLTATPHNGYPDSFTALLELLDSQRFARGINPDKNQLHQIMIRRLKEDLPPKWDGTPRFPKRCLESLAVAYTDEEQQAHSWLVEYTKLRQRDLDDPVEATATEFVLKLLKKRLFSSPAAFLTTIEKHLLTLQEDGNQSKRRYLAKPTLGILRTKLEQLQEEFADDEVSETCTSDVIASTSCLFRQLTPQEDNLLNLLLTWAKTASQQPDTKAQQLLNWIHTHLKTPDHQWNDQRVIIFTEYRTTQKWLYEILVNQGLATEDRLMILYGGMNSQERERIKAAFQANPTISQVRILLATDAASEGLDLQNYCANLIHYEIPWNPNRLEQRNGRIDRHGQKAQQVNIYHFVGENYSLTNSVRNPGNLEGDLEFLMRAVVKVNRIRQDLGKVGPVIASQIEDAMLGKRISLDTSLEEKDSEPIRSLLKFERKINEQIAQLKDQLQETRENLRITPDNILTVVSVGLEFADQPPLEPRPEQPGVYILPHLKGSWTVVNEGLAHPHTGVMRPIVFDPDVARGRDDVVLIHLNHKLVQMCIKLLRTEMWSRQDNLDSSYKLSRVSGRLVPTGVIEFPVVIVYGRLLILGSNHQRLHEEVITAGGLLKEGKYNALGVEKIKQILAAASFEPLPTDLQHRLASLWDLYYEPLRRGLAKRMSDRVTSVEKALSQQCEKEVNHITKILTELQNSITQQMQSSSQPQQLELFTPIEKEEFERNRFRLMQRLANIPLEIEQETSLIRSKFADPTPRLFPLAITYLVPKNLVSGI
ncbi:MAG: helicase [Gloeocapsa sp. DLM2.Bin57]|nr:MAG: helicase [Gloeocapsa sp. DLM2.Bin57]